MEGLGIIAMLILFAQAIACLLTGEKVQGCMFLAVMYLCWVVTRIQKSGGEEDG